MLLEEVQPSRQNFGVRAGKKLSPAVSRERLTAGELIEEENNQNLGRS
jgi:hypothetical protein